MNRPQAIPALDPLYADLRRRDPVRPAVLLDVRERDEFMAVRVQGCLFIPMSQLGVRMDEVPKDRPVECCDIHATIYHVLGVDPKVHFLDHSGRPVPALDSGEVIHELV